MLFMMYQPIDRNNKPLSYTPQTAHKLYFWWYKKCKNSDFRVVLCSQDESLPQSKCLLLLRVLLLVGKNDIYHWNPIISYVWALKNVIFKKSLLKEAKKSIFLFSDMKSWADPQDIMGDYTYQ